MEVINNMSKKDNDKNLTDLEMSNIEMYLNDGLRPSEIGKKLNRDPSGIRKEIKNYSTYFGKARKCSECLNKESCDKHHLCSDIVYTSKCASCKYCASASKYCYDFKINIECKTLDKLKVCNSCANRNKCRITLRYNGYIASTLHKAKMNNSHVGLKFSAIPDEMANFISNRIKAGISPDIVLHKLPKKFKKYKISTPTLYKYINLGLLDCKNIDLRNKVSRKERCKTLQVEKKVKGHQLNGRSIENLSEEDKKYPLGVAEIDTVEGIKGKALLLTIMIPKYSLMLAFKIKNKKQEEVKLKFDILEFKLKEDFYTLFRSLIPDNGVEFTDPELLEKSIYKDTPRCHVYYTHTYSSYEKPHVENNHILLRWLIKKGFDISLISDDKIIEIINVLNNYPRPNKGYKTPIELIEEDFGKDILRKLKLKKIKFNDLNLHISLMDDSNKQDIPF